MKCYKFQMFYPVLILIFIKILSVFEMRIRIRLLKCFYLETWHVVARACVSVLLTNNTVLFNRRHGLTSFLNVTLVYLCESSRLRHFSTKREGGTFFIPNEAKNRTKAENQLQIMAKHPSSPHNIHDSFRIFYPQSRLRPNWFFPFASVVQYVNRRTFSSENFALVLLNF